MTQSSNTGFTFAISADNQTSDAHPVSIGWTSIELRQTTGTAPSTGGEEQFYLNGVQIFDEKNVSNFDRTPSNVIIGGSQYPSPSTNTWNYYLADVVVSDSLIGNNQDQLTMQTNYGTLSPANGTHSELSTQTITATPPTTIPGERYVWQGWTGTGIGNYTGLGSLSSDGVSYTASVQMNSAITETASWQHQYQLTIFSSYGSAIGNSTWYPANTNANAVINPTTVGNPQNSTIPVGTQYVFTGWSPDVLGTGSTSNAINMTGPMTRYGKLADSILLDCFFSLWHSWWPRLL